MRKLANYLGMGLVLLTGCADMEVNKPFVPAEGGETPSAVNTKELSIDNPEPIAVVDMGNGQKVEFHDLNGFSVVTETGPAGNALPVLPKFRETQRADRPVDFFRALKPDLQVPGALVKLQERLAARPIEQQPRATLPMTMEYGGDPKPDPLFKVSTPEGCNNGCCDPDWLLPSVICPLGHDETWHLLNYGYSHATYSGLEYYTVSVCAATGTSRWAFKVCHNGCVQYNWDVPEATYRIISNNTTSLFFSFSIDSRVNTSASRRLHAHCGGVWQ